MSVPAGDTVTLPCHAAGEPEPHITWMLNGVELDDGSKRFQRKADGALHIVNVDASCVGSYECRANNSLGLVRSRRARLSIDQLQSDESVVDPGPQRPTIVLRPTGGTKSAQNALVLHCVANGETICVLIFHFVLFSNTFHVFFIILRVRLSGQPEPQIAWLLNGRPIGDDQSTVNVRVYDNGTLVIERPNMEDSGEYHCEATNYLGRASAKAVVTVQGELD